MFCCGVVGQAFDMMMLLGFDVNKEYVAEALVLYGRHVALRPQAGYERAIVCDDHIPALFL